jgi:hypothetical protein
MKDIYKKIFVIVGLFLSLTARAEKIILICKYDSGSEMMPFNIDLNSKIVIWGNVIYKPGEEWRLVGNNDRFLTMKSPDTDTTVGGINIVVDRFSGNFVLSSVILTISENKLDGHTGKGICNTKKI